MFVTDRIDLATSLIALGHYLHECLIQDFKIIFVFKDTEDCIKIKKDWNNCTLYPNIKLYLLAQKQINKIIYDGGLYA